MKTRFWSVMLVLSCFLAVASPMSAAADDQFAHSSAYVVLGSMSPLVTLCSDGLRKNLSATTPAAIAALPLHARTLFLEIAFGLLAVLVFKDVLGALFLPLKKALDAVDVIQNNVMSILCAFFVVPHFAGSVSPYMQKVAAFAGDSLLSVNAAWAASSGGIDAGLGAAAWVLAYLAGFLVFYAVWSTFHLVNVLNMLSPVPFLGFALKVFRIGLMSLLLFAFFLSPVFGLVLAALVVIMGIKMMGWATRLMVFGSVVSFDILGRRWRLDPGDKPVTAFSGTGLHDVPKRVCGRLHLGRKGMAFAYRPWFIGPLRFVPLDVAPGRYVFQKGLFCPLVAVQEEKRHRTLFLLSPRYRTHEGALAARVGAHVGETKTMAGLRMAMEWIRSIVSEKRASPV